MISYPTAANSAPGSACRHVISRTVSQLKARPKTAASTAIDRITDSTRNPGPMKVSPNVPADEAAEPTTVATTNPTPTITTSTSARRMDLKKFGRSVCATAYTSLKAVCAVFATARPEYTARARPTIRASGLPVRLWTPMVCPFEQCTRVEPCTGLLIELMMGKEPTALQNTMRY